MIRALLILFILSSIAQAQVLEAPSGLEGTWLADSSQIQLEWDSLHKDIAGYHLFVQQPSQDKLFLWAAAGQIHTNSYSFQVLNNSGGEYHFSVAAFRNFPDLVYGERSPDIIVNVPSSFLPMVSNVRPVQKKNELVISWEYPNRVWDLDHFEVQLNDTTLRVQEDQFNAHIPNLPELTYSISVFAVSSFGLKSKGSPTKYIKVK